MQQSLVIMTEPYASHDASEIELSQAFSTRFWKRVLTSITQTSMLAASISTKAEKQKLRKVFLLLGITVALVILTPAHA
jgi:hypothetical protein